MASLSKHGTPPPRPPLDVARDIEEAGPGGGRGGEFPDCREDQQGALPMARHGRRPRPRAPHHPSH